jgi:hypothetical protein
MAQIIEAQSFRQLSAFQYRLKMFLYDIQPYKRLPFTSGKYKIKTGRPFLCACLSGAWELAQLEERFG